MNTEIENIANTLKGVACILSSMSEVPQGSMVWNEFAMHLLCDSIEECVKKLEELA